jgi:hypothetical protein
VKSRVKELVKERGRGEAQADERVELISGHSLRAGYATSRRAGPEASSDTRRSD